jgi:hypothetical protein
MPGMFCMSSGAFTLIAGFAAGLAAGFLAEFTHGLASVGAVLMSLSTISVALNGQLMKREQL